MTVPLFCISQLRSGPVDPESLQQQATGCGLGLAILAAACRLPEVAQGREVRELVPVLLQVGRGRLWGQHGNRSGAMGWLRLSRGRLPH